MSAAKHTPGPWKPRAANVGGDFGIIAPDANAEGGWVCVAECFSDIRRANERALPEAAANALLISMAPTMLEALVEAAGALQGAAECMRKVDALKTAEHLEEIALAAMLVLAKATGARA
jgi:hypothetical protein